MISYSLRGTKEARKLLDSLSGRELTNRTRRAVRKGAAVARKELRSTAKDSRYPSAYSASVAQGGIATKNHHTHGIATSVGPTTPLLNIFEGGAGSHMIAPGRLNVGGRGLLLSGKAGDRWRGSDFVASEPVRHPGMAAVPLIAPVFAAKNDEMSEAAMDELLRGLR